MEIPEVILIQARRKSTSSSIHEGLRNVLIKLEDKTLEDFLNGEKHEAIRTIDSEIRNIITTTVYYNRGTEEEKVAVLSQIIFTATKYFQKGILNGDARAILIFLLVNCYLQLEIEKLLTAEELQETHSKPVSEKIIKILSSINLTTQSLPDAPYHEKEMITESTEGFANNNIVKTYKLIEAIERSGRGFHFNFLLENLLSFLCQINFTSFIKALSHLQNPTDFVFYFQSLKKEDLLKIAKEHSLSNKWLNFEIIRQIVEKERKEVFEDSEKEAIKAILDRIRITDFDFFKQTVKYFHTSRLFNASLGSLVVSISNYQIEEVIFECFTIDAYSNNLDSRDAFREQFVKDASEEQFDFLHTVAFNKWKNYFDNSITAEDFYQNGLLTTDFANFVVYYHTHLTEESSLISMMKNLIDKINFIDSEWTSSKSNQLTKFHLYHSELFLLTFAYRNKRLNEAQILAIYEELISNTIQLSRYVSEETKNLFKQGRQNIDWIKEYAT